MPLRSADDLLARAAAVPGAAAVLDALAGVSGVHLVGGVPRDLLLGRPPLDLDLVVEGDALAAAHAAAARLGGTVVEHDRFGTATVTAPGVVFDLAAARRERYPAPGALPEVEPAGIDADLARRDVTVNALALAVGGPERGRLRHVPHALEDLEAGRLRVLHEASFRDDPTRLLRLVRYAARLGFAIEPGSERLARAAIAAGALATVSGARLGRELRLLLAEPDPVAALAAADALGLLAALGPRPARGAGPAPASGAEDAVESAPVAEHVAEPASGAEDAVESVPDAEDTVESAPGAKDAVESVPDAEDTVESAPGAGYPAVPQSDSAYDDAQAACLALDAELVRAAAALLPPDGRRGRLALAATARALAPEALRHWLDELAFGAAERDAIVATAGAAAPLADRLAVARRPSQIAAAVGELPLEAVALAGALGPRGAATRWLAELRHVRCELRGEDLLAAGVPRGPAIGRALAAARAARLDGSAADRAGELAAALAAVGGWGDRPA